MNLSPKRRAEMARWKYLVAETNELTQQSLAENYARRGEGEVNTTSMQYGKNQRRVEGYLVNLTAVKRLVDSNRGDPKFVFVIYYQKPGADDRWFMLKTAQKTPSQQLHIAVTGDGLNKKPAKKVATKLGAMMPRHRSHTSPR